MFRDGRAGRQAGPEPHDLVLAGQAGEAAQRQRGVDHWCGLLDSLDVVEENATDDPVDSKCSSCTVDPSRLWPPGTAEPQD